MSTCNATCRDKSTEVDFEHRLVAFEEAWRSGEQPDLEKFLAPSPECATAEQSAVRVRELLDLIPLDLEYRWRGSASRQRGLLPSRPRLEHYLELYPELECRSGAILELIAAEYRIRFVWGDQPDGAEYLTRFPALGGVLGEELRRIDEEIAREHCADPREAGQIPRLTSLLTNRTSATPGLVAGGLEDLGELGRGGMGVVSKAWDVRLGRVVAVKTILEAHHARADAIERFRLEAHAVARLNHPNIVQIHEVGERDQRPYVVLEYVEGGSLAERLKSNPMAPRQAAELVEKLAGAVAAIHGAGIVHRDLKPSNILLSADGTPKVTDFGLAKLADADTSRTISGELLGSPGYMAPEQAAGRAHQVGWETDVHALGLILFEALTGRPPFLGNSRDETLRLVISTAPVPPGRLRPDVPRDLETICLKCLEKEPRKRYGTAAALAVDLRCHLEGRPIHARPVGKLGHAWRWSLRNPALAALIATLVTTFVLGTPTLLTLWLRARTDRALALSESENAQAILEFLGNLLAQASAHNQARPGTKPDPNLMVRTALDRAAVKIGDRFAERPLVEASIRHMLGKTYYELGLLPQAQSHLERALDLRRLQLGPEALDTLRIMLDLGMLFHADSKLPEAEPYLKQAAEGLRRARGESHPETYIALHSLGQLYSSMERQEEAEALLVTALRGLERTRGPQDLETLGVMVSLASLYQDKTKLGLAESLLDRAISKLIATVGDEHPLTFVAKENLGAVYLGLGKRLEAERLLTTVLKGQRRVLGDKHPATLHTMVKLGEVLIFENKLDQAEPLLTEAVNGCRIALDHKSETIDSALAFLGAVYAINKDLKKLGPVLLESREICLFRWGPDHALTAAANEAVGKFYFVQGDYARAEPYFRDFWNHGIKNNRQDWGRFAAEIELGLSVLGQSRFEEAEPLLRSGYDGMNALERNAPADKKDLMSQTIGRISQLYEKLGRKEKGAEWRKLMK